MARTDRRSGRRNPREGAGYRPVHDARGISFRCNPMNVALRWQSSSGLEDQAERLGRLATLCLKLEVKTFPKPGLVSHVDNGSHTDMDAELLCRSADTLTPFFGELAIAGGASAG